MLLRCASGMLKAPAVMAAGLVFATGMAAGLALGAGAVGAALVGKRLWEERQGWRGGASGADDAPAEPAPEAPGL
jgi:hypothetical protein